MMARETRIPEDAGNAPPGDAGNALQWRRQRTSAILNAARPKQNPIDETNAKSPPLPVGFLIEGDLENSGGL